MAHAERGLFRRVYSIVTEEDMVRTLVVCGMILSLAGCERSIISPTSTIPVRIEQYVLIGRFNESDTVLVGPNGFRVGWYHDFSPYDSLIISFSANRLAAGDMCSHVLIRIGPATYIGDSLMVSQKDFSIRIRTSDLEKPHSSALTFFAPDPEAALLLSHLRVIGWCSF